MYSVYTIRPGTLPSAVEVARVKDIVIKMLSALAVEAQYNDIYGMMPQNRKKHMMLYLYWIVLCTWISPTSTEVINYYTAADLVKLLARMTNINKICC